MTVAIWNGVEIAASDDTIVVEGNHYFPPTCVHTEYLKPSSASSQCPWKGQAHYYSLVVNGKTNADAAWSYADPSVAAANVKDYVAFWKGVEIK